ncbi:MarR family transcriptional regulator [Izhakiella australiensis]|uniref:MarR family transcriptional regulator n=1 Tax=Izhakiella australiensis TaxID=1926881 RepID=A0A1S8YCX9_9GAMM|nr:MarR family winged helix-turn-helix transcriptional regulator [Izhakiella australiensis]OON36979.1 MarR family transcriptional regulator [Izhakiella australiensis]
MQNTPNSGEFDALHNALLNIVGAFNRPQRDEVLIKQAGIPLDRALFPLLVSIDRFGPVGVVELADRVGRDYTTVSRQVAKLVELGLAVRQKGQKDKRVHEAVISPQGKKMTDRVDAARNRLYQQVFSDWQAADRAELTRLVERFAQAFSGREED